MKTIIAITKNEKTAVKNIEGAFNWIVGGYLNYLMDGYTNDIPTLNEAMDEVYNSAMNDDYRMSGAVSYDDAPREMRFAGEDFCREVVEHLFAEDDDVKTIWSYELQELQPAEINEHGCVDCSNCILNCIHRDCMRRNPREVGGLGECPRLYVKDNTQNTVEEDKEENTMAKDWTREEAKAYILKTYTAKEMRDHLKEAGFTGYSRAKKEVLAEAMLALEELNNGKKTAEISKVKLYTFTGMYIGEYDATVEGDKILVVTKQKGELMFDLNTGKEITDERKAKWANKVERV